MSELRLYTWEDDQLMLRVENKFYPSSISDAAKELSPKSLSCLALRIAESVSPKRNGTTIITAPSDRDAERCVEIMGRQPRCSIKWSSEQDGGSMFFDEGDER